jgi:hypothetical protein
MVRVDYALFLISAAITLARTTGFNAPPVYTVSVRNTELQGGSKRMEATLSGTSPLAARRLRV